MNHLRELIDAFRSGRVLTNPAIPAEAVQPLARQFQSEMQHAICFSIGDVADINGLRIVPELCKLPFPTCWMEYSCQADQISPDRFTVGALVVSSESEVAITMFLRAKSGTWALQSAALMNSLAAPDDLRMVPSDQGAQVSALMTRSAICAFLSAMNCSNVKRVENHPDLKLQKARAKRGKAPLFSYWTLELNTRSRSESSGEGTHESPRLHLRRGHPRKYLPGKWTWVQACMVGNKARGMVHKDYAASDDLVRAMQDLEPVEG